MESLEQAREKLRKRLEELKPKGTSPDDEKGLLPKKRYSLLILEDEQLNLDALVETFKNDYEVLPFTSAVDALEHVRTKKPHVDLVLTDQRMPKMSGTQFLEEINKIYPKVMKIVLTGYTETRDLMEAINKGEVHRYITKPADPSYLKIEVKQALERYRLEQEKHQLVLVLMDKNKSLENYQNELKKTNLEILRILGTLGELKDPDTGRHALFVAQATEFICQKLGLSQEETMKAVQTAHLHDLGKMGLPDWVVKGAGATTEAAENYYRQHPLLSEAVLLVSERLMDVAPGVRHHHEWWNGAGFPDGLKGDAIPLAARIIAIPDGYDEFLLEANRTKSSKESSQEKGIKFLKENSEIQFDPQLIPHFIEFLQHEVAERKEKFVSLDELQDGMVISQDVLTERGFVIIPRGTRLKKDFLAKVKGFSTYIGIRQPIGTYID